METLNLDRKRRVAYSTLSFKGEQVETAFVRFLSDEMTVERFIERLRQLNKEMEAEIKAFEANPPSSFMVR